MSHSISTIFFFVFVPGDRGIHISQKSSKVLFFLAFACPRRRKTRLRPRPQPRRAPILPPRITLLSSCGRHSPRLNVPPRTSSAQKVSSGPTPPAARLQVLTGLLTSITGNEFTRVRDTCLILQAAAAPTTSDPQAIQDFRTFLQEQERRKVQPWRISEATHAAERAAVAKGCQARHKDEFLELAKASVIAPDDVMALTYALSSTTEEDLLQYSDWLLHKDAQARIRAHNWLVASKRESAFVDVHGATTTRWPRGACARPAT